MLSKDYLNISETVSEEVLYSRANWKKGDTVKKTRNSTLSALKGIACFQ